MDRELNELAMRALRDGELPELRTQHFINGTWQSSRAGRTMDTLDPGNGRVIAAFAAGDADDVDEAVQAAQGVLVGAWAKCPPAERGRILSRAAELIRQNAKRLAVIESLDSGKPIGEAFGDVLGAARAFEYYAGAADKLEGTTIPLGLDYLAYTVNEPIGVTAHIIPWNFPISTTARSIAPALAAGCSAVAKPAEQTPLTALLLADILKESGLPDGVYNVVTGLGLEVGAPLVSHPLVRHVTFTGSTDTGRHVMTGAARNLANVVLELGGKSPIVALADCDMEQTVQGTLGAIYEHAGQVCSAGSRLIVERTIHDQLLERLVPRAEELSFGHGLRNPQIGAINSREQHDKIIGHVEAARTRGVDIVTGGNATTDPETGDGFFFEPTICDRVPADDPIVREEIFGPVLSIQIADDAEHALALANDSAYGLVAGIYTRDINHALRLARDINAGQIYINEYFAGGIEVPFGGNKLSGFGREKGLEGLHNYCRSKSVVASLK